MSSWFYIIFIDGCMEEITSKVVYVGARVKLSGLGWSVMVFYRKIMVV